MQNLSECKKQYVDYINPSDINNGQFYIDVKASLEPVYKQINTYYGDPNAVVAIDIDDTMITTFFFMHNQNLNINIQDKDFGWTQATIEESFRVTSSLIMPAIKPILDLVDYCYTNKMLVYVLTGRREQYRSNTSMLLYDAGYKDKYELIAMKPDDSELTDAEFKAEQIDDWISRGKKVIAMVGDQENDTLNNAKLKCRIPNYGYDLTIEY